METTWNSLIKCILIFSISLFFFLACISRIYTTILYLSSFKISILYLKIHLIWVIFILLQPHYHNIAESNCVDRQFHFTQNAIVIRFNWIIRLLSHELWRFLATIWSIMTNHFIINEGETKLSMSSLNFALFPSFGDDDDLQIDGCSWEERGISISISTSFNNICRAISWMSFNKTIIIMPLLWSKWKNAPFVSAYSSFQKGFFL